MWQLLTTWRKEFQAYNQIYVLIIQEAMIGLFNISGKYIVCRQFFSDVWFLFIYLSQEKLTWTRIPLQRLQCCDALKQKKPFWVSSMIFSNFVLLLSVCGVILSILCVPPWTQPCELGQGCSDSYFSRSGLARLFPAFFRQDFELDLVTLVKYTLWKQKDPKCLQSHIDHFWCAILKLTMWPWRSQRHTQGQQLTKPPEGSMTPTCIRGLYIYNIEKSWQEKNPAHMSQEVFPVEVIWRITLDLQPVTLKVICRNKNKTINFIRKPLLICFSSVWGLTHIAYVYILWSGCWHLFTSCLYFNDASFIWLDILNMYWSYSLKGCDMSELCFLSMH